MFRGSPKHRGECDEIMALNCDNRRKEGIVGIGLTEEQSLFFPLILIGFSVSFSSSLSLCSILHAGIVLNIGWHCWRHLGQSCFDFIIHVSCSRLGLLM